MALMLAPIVLLQVTLRHPSCSGSGRFTHLVDGSVGGAHCASVSGTRLARSSEGPTCLAGASVGCERRAVVSGAQALILHQALEVPLVLVMARLVVLIVLM